MRTLLAKIRRRILSDIKLIMGVKIVGLNRFSLLGQLIINGVGNIIE